jgi:hypothetical protein
MAHEAVFRSTLKHDIGRIYSVSVYCAAEDADAKIIVVEWLFMKNVKTTLEGHRVVSTRVVVERCEAKDLSEGIDEVSVHLDFGVPVSGFGSSHFLTLSSPMPVLHPNDHAHALVACVAKRRDLVCEVVVDAV